MARSIFLLVAIALVCAGCNKPASPLSGGKPLSHWFEKLNDPDPTVRKTALTKLGNAGPGDPNTFRGVLDALKDPDPGVRCEGILAILKFGPERKEAIPALEEAARKDPDGKVRSYAQKALEAI